MQHTVLVVDDEPAIREMLTDALSREPYEVLCAGSAEEALAVLAEEPVDVVISDEVMPGMSGSEMPSQWKNPGPGPARLLWIKIK